MAIGAIGAALIGAMISLVGLIVAKEAKVSEFRQSWIDALRAELSAFLTNANAVSDARSLKFKDDKERFEKIQPFYSKLNEAYYLVALRLNATEHHSSKLKSCMVEISSMIEKPGALDNEAFERSRVNFITVSNQLLKEEWKRVKSGEKVYRTSRWFALGVVISLLLLAALAVVERRSVATPTHVIEVSKPVPMLGKPMRPSIGPNAPVGEEQNKKAETTFKQAAHH